MALCMLVSCNFNTEKQQQQEEQTMEISEPFNFIEEPQIINCADHYTIFQTLGEDYGLARSIDTPTLVIVITDSVCYDEMQVSTSDSTEFRMIGTYEYQSLDSLFRTVPILRLYNKSE